MDYYCYCCYVVAVVAEWLIALQPPHGEARGGDSVKEEGLGVQGGERQHG